MSIKKNSQKIILGIYSIEEVFYMLEHNEKVLIDKHNPKASSIIVNGKFVRVNSQRYELFSKNITCVHCGKIGTHFKLISTADNPERAHFDLFSDDDILFTKDHIIPKSKGGKDILSNYQTMCVNCNKEKGNKYDG